MKHLINFSLSRRFKNKVTIILHILITTLLFAFMFSDKIVDKLFVNSQNPTIIYFDKSAEDYIDYFDHSDELFQFKKGVNKDSISLSKKDDWIVNSEYPLDPITFAQVSILLENATLNRWLSEMSSESASNVLDNLYPNITEVSKMKTTVSTDKQTISMFMITGMYFAMLSFSTMIANEVVYEKTSRVLELILTSVNTTAHYLSKMIIGWLTIIIQLFFIILEVSIAIATRNYYDQGFGLLKMLSKYQIIQVKANTFTEFIKALEINSSLLWILLVSLVYLLLGMIIIQTIMVCLASFIKSVEESSAIQAPVYIVLLVIYYLALAFNSPNHLSEGLGYYFSMVPIFSMLFMPMRLLLLDVSLYEITLGIMLSIMTLSITTYYGAYVYNIGILGGLNMKKRSKTNKKYSN